MTTMTKIAAEALTMARATYALAGEAGDGVARRGWVRAG